MSIEAMAWAWAQPVRGTKKLVLLALGDWSDDEFASWHATTSLAARCSVSRSQVFVLLRELEDEGYVKRESRDRTDGSRTSNRYVLPVGRGLSSPQDGGLNPQENPQGNQKETPVSPSPIDEVWATFVEVIKPRQVKLDPAGRKVIADALKVASVAECQVAIRGFALSEWHMGQNPQRKPYRTISYCLRGKVGKKTTRETIDGFIDDANAVGIGGAGGVVIDGLKLSRSKQDVMKAWSHPLDEFVVSRADEARVWLGEHGHRVIDHGREKPPTIVRT